MKGRPRKFTPEQVCEIRTARNYGETLQSLANRYGVSHVAIMYLVRGTTYGDVSCK